MARLWATIGAVLVTFGFLGLFVGAGALLTWTQVVIGLGLLGLAVVQGSDRFAEVFWRGSSRHGANVLLQTAIVCTIAGLAAFLSVRHPVNWDWTEAQVHTLAQGSLDVLAQIPEDQHVQIIGFFTAGNEFQVEKTLDLYAYNSDRVRLSFEDANQRPDLAARFEIRTEGVIIVCAGDCETAAGTVRLAEVTENEVTKAIRSVISEQRVVYFLSGHGEGSITERGAEGFEAARLRLEDENIQVEELLLANESRVPEEADALIIAGPSHSVLARELDLIDAYLRAGGSLLVLADPFVVTGLEERVADWGIELGDDVVVEEQLQLFAGPKLGVQPVVTTYGIHAITDKMRGQATLFSMARSVRRVEADASGDGADAALGFVELALTSRASWAETDTEAFARERVVQLDPAVDRAGPVAVAAALVFPVEDGREGRLVVVGDADFARNRYIAEVFNADFLLNVVSWLVGEEQFITIDRKLPRASMVQMTAEQFSRVRFISLFVFPEAILLLGIASWWRRRT